MIYGVQVLLAKWLFAWGPSMVVVTVFVVGLVLGWWVHRLLLQRSLRQFAAMYPSDADALKRLATWWEIDNGQRPVPHKQQSKSLDKSEKTGTP